jgi:hypothetical protein
MAVNPTDPMMQGAPQPMGQPPPEPPVDLSEGTPPQPGEQGLPDAEEVYAEFKARLRQSNQHQKDWRTEARSLYDLVAGHQWSEEDLAKLKDQLRPAVTFNVAGKFIDAVQGLQINNRQDIRYFPRENGASALNEELTGAVTWARDLCDMADEESDAFLDCVLTGLGWVECFLNDDGEPAGLPAGERRDPLQMRWDGKARKKNLSDGRFVIRVTDMDQTDYKAKFKEEADTAPETDFMDFETDEDDIASPQIIPQPHDYPTGEATGPGGAPLNYRPKVAHYEFWRREQQYMVKTATLGEQTFKGDEWAHIEPMLKQRQIPYKATPRMVKVYYRAFVTTTGVKQLARSPYQGGFTFHAITGKRDRNNNLWYGIGRALVDPQLWVNKFFSAILFSIMTGSKGGLMAEEDAFTDARKAEENWSSPDAITWLKTGALGKGKIQQKEPAPFPSGMDRLMEFSMAALPSTSGLNLELLGLVDRQQAGVLEAQRKQSAMAIIAWAFDAMKRYYRSVGRQMARYFVDYVPEGELIRVTQDTGQGYVPLRKDRLALAFDVIVDEAPTSVNMKERVWAVLEQLIPQLLAAKMPVPAEVLDYSPLPADLTQKWKNMLHPDPEAHDKSQKQFEAMINKLVSEAMKNQASAKDLEADAALKQAQTEELTHTMPHDIAKAHADSLLAASEAGAAQAGQPNTGGLGQ